MTRHRLSCTAMSTTIDSAMAQANAAPSWTVIAAVWVMNPGPIALVAIRKMAPSTAERRALPVASVVDRSVTDSSGVLMLVSSGPAPRARGRHPGESRNPVANPHA